MDTQTQNAAVRLPRRAREQHDPMRRRVSELQRELDLARAELEALRSMAYTDPLTGLHNRRSFDQRLGEELSRTRRARGAFSVLVLDLDDFKLINDTRGHQEGDSVLCAVAEALKKTLREHDVICRTGGDEFVVILPQADRSNVESILLRLERRLAVADRGQPISASIGVASFPVDGTNAGSLVAHADAEMYEDKRHKHERGACVTE